MSPDGRLAETSIPWFGTDHRQTALASTGDSTVLLVHMKATSSLRSALYGRFVPPRRRAAGRSE